MVQIPIKGDIVDNETGSFYDFFDIACVYPQAIENQLKQANGQPVEVDIASNGGDVFAGSEIYTMLKAYNGPVTVNIVGLAASAASVIAMAGDKVNISPTAQIMIHQAWSMIEGNSDDLNHESQVLSNIDQSIVNAYVAKTGQEPDQLLQMMRNETWMTAQQAVDNGFADAILFVDEKQPQIANSLEHSFVTKSAINKLKTMQMQLQHYHDEQKQPVKHDDLLKAKLNILRGEKNED